MATKARRTKPTYDDQFRASAVVMLKSQGYPEMIGALSMVAKHLKVPTRTLRRWWTGASHPPPDNLVTGKTFDMRGAIQAEMEAILTDMPVARADATYPQLGTVYGILFDKARLLDGLPTSVVAILPELVAELERSGVLARDVFQAMLNKAKAANANR